MPKRVAVFVAVLALGAPGAALADPDRPRPSPPFVPPGLAQSGADRPDQARCPTTGPTNRYFHGTTDCL